MVIIRKANNEDIKALSRKLLALLENKKSKIYLDNVVKFGIPDEYVKKAFAKETLLKAITKGKATFYLALENNDIIGFAQTIQQDANTAELDRIIIFPPHERRGNWDTTAATCPLRHGTKRNQQCNREHGKRRNLR